MRSSRWVHSLIALLLIASAQLVFAPFARAAVAPTPAVLLIVEVAEPVTGRVGEVITVNYTVSNTTRETLADRVIELRAAPNAVLVTYSGRDCTGRDITKIAVCKPNAPYRPGKTEESFTIRITAASAGPGGYGMVWVRRPTGSGGYDRYLVSGTDVPSPAASKSPTRRATVSVPPVPTAPPEESGAAANVVESTETEPVTTEAVANESAGLATGMWIGVGAILVGIGLLATLLVMRRRETDDADESIGPFGQYPSGPVS